MKLLSACVALLLSLFLGSVRAAVAEDRPVIVSAEELMSMRDDSETESKLILLDVRSQEAYQKGHISKALWVDLAKLKKQSASDDSMRDANGWNKVIADYGISQNSVVVVYGEPLTDAARVWWFLRYVGIEAQLLDGGLAAWQKANGELSLEPGKAVSAIVPFEVSFQADRLATTDEVLASGVQSKACQIVDNRSDEEFSGKAVRGARGGHIPNAKHLDWVKFVGKDSKLLPKDELTKIVADAGIQSDQPVTTHCQSGGRSSVGALVIEWVTGQPVKNYYGSWGQWSADASLPIE